MFTLQSNNMSGMSYFIAASILIHFLVLTFTPEPTLFVKQQQRGEINNITLITNNVEARPVRINRPNKANKIVGKSENINAKSLTKSVKITNKTSSPKPGKINIPPPTAQISTTEGIDQLNRTTKKQKLALDTDLILNKIRSKLKRYFNYPKLAVKKNIQGEVTLGFRIETNGNIVDIYIAKSSGYAMLDRAAKNSLKKVQFIPLADATINKVLVNLQLPVIYQLQES